jgi:hypothetical protein
MTGDTKKMNKMILASFAVAAIILNVSAQAAEYSALKRYQTLGAELLKKVQVVEREADLDRVALEVKTRELVQQGIEIMNLYVEKNPQCAAQYKVFLQELPAIERKPLDEIHSRYHDGTGLPAAPKHCYFGRSEIVHPVMNLVRLRGSWTDSAKKEMTHDFKEVIEHLARIQKNLDHPPR